MFIYRIDKNTYLIKNPDWFTLVTIKQYLSLSELDLLLKDDNQIYWRRIDAHSIVKSIIKKLELDGEIT